MTDKERLREAISFIEKNSKYEGDYLHQSPLMEHLKVLIKAAESTLAQGWRTIIDNEFESGKRFLVVTEMRIPFIAWRYKRNTWCSYDNPIIYPTHFMPLPQPPDEGKL